MIKQIIKQLYHSKLETEGFSKTIALKSEAQPDNEVFDGTFDTEQVELSRDSKEDQR